MKTKSGFMLIEAVLALALFGTLAVASTIAIMENQTTSERLVKNREALYLVKAVLEKTIAFGTSHEATEGIISASSSVQAVTKCLSFYTAEAHWNDEGFRHILFSTLVASTSAIAALGGDCGGFASHYLPKGFLGSLSSSSAVALPENSGSAADVVGGRAFIASSDATNTVISVNFTNGIPIIDSTISTTAVNALDAVRGFVFAAVAGSSSQIRILETSPTLSQIASATLPKVSGSFPAGLSIYYYSERLYVGVHRTAGNEFHIFDVSNPALPNWLGSIELNHNINDIVVSGPYAYLATSGNVSDIIILDVSNPSHIVEVGKLSFPGSEDTLHVSLLGATLYAGRAKGTSSSHPEFIIIDVSSSTAPVVRGKLSLGTTIRALTSEGDYVALATDLGTYIVDVTNPTAPTSTRLSTIPSTGIDYENGTLYVLHNSYIETFK